MWIPQPKQMWLPGQPKPPVGTQIDWTDPLSQGLVGCWLFNEGGGYPKNLLSGVSSALGGLGSIGWSANKFKLTNTYYRTYGKVPLSAMTLIVSGSFIDAGAAANVFHLNGTANYPKIEFRRNDTASNSVLVYWNATGYRYVNFPAGCFLTSGSYAITTQNDISAPIVKGYFNGALAPNGGSSTGAPSATGVLQLGNSNSSGIDAELSCIFMFNRILSAEEIQRLHELTKGW